MALTALPVELLDAILTPLTHHHSALAAVARTCPALNPSATRLLYRHLSLSAYARNLALIHQLAARPDLAKHVRTFTIHLDDAQPASLPAYSALQRALHLMPNISSLALYVDATASWVLSPPKPKSERVQSSPTPFYPRLEHLTCNFPLDAHLSSFLGQTPSLLSLTLPSVHSADEGDDHPAAPTADPPPSHVLTSAQTLSAGIPPSHIPRLAQYTGPAHLLPTLLSRPLQVVHLFGDLTPALLAAEPVPDPAAGAPSTEHAVRPQSHTDRITATHPFPSAAGPQLQVMSAMTSVPPAQLLEAVAGSFPNLVCLRLMTTRALWDLPDMAFYTRIAATLSKMPRLSAFELAGMHWQSRPKSPEEKEWISPPVSPRFIADAEEEDEGEEMQDRDYDFDGAFLDWSY